MEHEAPNLERGDLDVSVAKEKLLLIKESFKNVLDSDVHLDNKASRVLSAMAFLTAASAAVLGRVFPLPDEMNTPMLFGIQWALLCFVVFGVLILLGSLMYIAALGPSLNLKHFQVEQQDATNPKSLLFFDVIGQFSMKEWTSYWEDTTLDALNLKLLNNFVAETLLIAQKTRSKYAYMSIGSLLLKLAILFLAFLIVGLIVKDVTLFRLLVIGMALAWVVTIGIEIVNRPNWTTKQPSLKIAGLVLIVIFSFIVAFMAELKPVLPSSDTSTQIATPTPALTETPPLVQTNTP